MHLLVSVSGLEPGAPLDAAMALADALDARRVPLTLLVGPCPHPELASWAAARRRVGDATLLHGTRTAPAPGRPSRRLELRSAASPSRRVELRSAASPYRRLPAHEAGLRLTAALRSRDAVRLPVDGFAAPGWAISAGVRAALAGAGIGLVVDDLGVHRLHPDGTTAATRRGPALGLEPPRRRRRPEPLLRHLALEATAPIARAGEWVDRALAAGALPVTPAELLTAPTPRRPRPAGDPEHWSITA